MFPFRPHGSKLVQQIQNLAQKNFKRTRKTIIVLFWSLFPCYRENTISNIQWTDFEIKWSNYPKPKIYTAHMQHPIRIMLDKYVAVTLMYMTFWTSALPVTRKDF